MGAKAIGSGDGGDDEEGDIVAEINITPLTDIFLVLLIIFMVTTTVAEDEGKNIDLPEATESEETPPKGVTVAVEAEGVIRINDNNGALFPLLWLKDGSVVCDDDTLYDKPQGFKDEGVGKPWSWMTHTV